MSKIMTHLREHKNAYIFVGAGAATATIGFVLGVRASKSEAQVVQKVVQRNVSMQSSLQFPLERLRKRSLRSIPKRNTKKLWLL